MLEAIEARNGNKAKDAEIKDKTPSPKKGLFGSKATPQAKATPASKAAPAATETPGAPESPMTEQERKMLDLVSRLFHS